MAWHKAIISFLTITLFCEYSSIRISEFVRKYSYKNLKESIDFANKQDEIEWKIVILHQLIAPSNVQEMVSSSSQVENSSQLDPTCALSQISNQDEAVAQKPKQKKRSRVAARANIVFPAVSQPHQQLLAIDYSEHIDETIQPRALRKGKKRKEIKEEEE